MPSNGNTETLSEDIVEGLAKIKGLELLETWEMFVTDHDELARVNRNVHNKLLGIENGEDEEMRRMTILADNIYMGDKALESTKPAPTQTISGTLMPSQPSVQPKPQPVVEPTKGAPAWLKWVAAAIAGSGIGLAGWGLGTYFADKTDLDTDTRNTIRFEGD